jgi:glutathione S-transferase
MADFSNCTLFISARSPFARRVRLALLEAEVPFQEKVFDVFKPAAELIEDNPLARVPSLRLATGEVLIDSNVILRAFSESRPGFLIPKSEDRKLRVYRWMGLATGMCDKVVEYFLETTRPEAKQDLEVLNEIKEIQSRFLKTLEEDLSSETAGDFICGADLTQADLDIGCALGYMSLRMGTTWTGLYPRASHYFKKLELRPSFIKTRPPA